MRCATTTLLSLVATMSSAPPKTTTRGLSTVRLDKYLVDVGAAASRSASVALIRSGRVTVDGTITRSNKVKIDRETTGVTLDGTSVARLQQKLPLLCAYHKPLDVHCTMRDLRGRRDLSTVLADAPAPWRRALHPVGRLDADTTGLLLFCSNGDLTHRLLHPSYAVEKEYVAQCEVRDPALVDAAALAARLKQGVRTTLGTHAATLLDARRLCDDDAAADAKGDDRDDAEKKGLLEVRLVVTEGKHRMVRRVLYNVGLPVVHLRRARFGPVLLGDLPLGAVRPIEDPAVAAWARGVLGLPPAEAVDDDHDDENRPRSTTQASRPRREPDGFGDHHDERDQTCSPQDCCSPS